MRRRNEGPGLGALLLGMQLFRMGGLDAIPPATLFLVALNALVWYQPAALPFAFPSATEACLSPVRVLQHDARQITDSSNLPASLCTRLLPLTLFI